MQTFLPYRDFEKVADCLDRQRLGKQRVEVLQILSVLNGETTAWRNHPAVLMWDGYIEALIEYGIAIIDEWIRRGYVDNLRSRIVAYSWGGPVIVPPWLNRRLILSHRSNLIRKLPSHYARLWPDVPNDIPYYWPVQKVR